MPVWRQTPQPIDKGTALCHNGHVPKERVGDPWFSIRAPQELIDRLTAAAAAKGYSRSAFVRLILERGLMFADAFAHKLPGRKKAA